MYDAGRLLLSPNDDLDSKIPICPGSTLATAWSTEIGRSVVISVGCRRWACSFCGRRKVAALAKRVEAAKPSRLVTLTVDPSRWDSPRHAYDGTRRALSPFTRAMRRTGEFEYLRVLEMTKKGWPHYHLLVRSGYRHYGDIQKVWAELTGARIVDVRKVKQEDQVYWYLVKYLAKQHYCEFTDRRLSWTGKFFPPKKTYKDLGLVDWQREGHSLHTWLRYRGEATVLYQITSYMWTLGERPNVELNTFEDQEGDSLESPS
jgi:hypothetical protein